MCEISTIVVGNAWATREDEVVACLQPTARRLVLIGDCSYLGLPSHKLVGVCCVFLSCGIRYTATAVADPKYVVRIL